ncbi:MAG: ParB/RepB/Spo0J family partition protein [Xanthomonadales bacterium]|nr:ParB/RepB/Spo0J family partition protein [Xanthomonadales bacterium]
MLSRSTEETEATDAASLRELPLDLIQPGRYQPRSVMDPERLEELASSIRAQGVVQPIVVRKLDAGQYEIIAGERRWRAAQKAGLHDIPAVVRQVSDEVTMAMALIENIQREDLNPLEEATALHRLIDEFAMTHQQAADAVGRSRAAVSNLLRLLELPSEVRDLVDRRQLDMGHARALLALPKDLLVATARRVALEQLSVRETEKLVRQLLQPPKDNSAKSAGRDPDIQRLENELRDTLGAKVAVQHQKNGKGKLVIHYHDLDHLEGVLDKLR